MTNQDLIKNKLSGSENTWLITGVAGFIGSNLLERLLSANQKVIGLDNFSTGNKANFESIKKSIKEDLWKNFTFVEGDITCLKTCQKVCKGIDFVLHQAALGSVPRSLKDPLATNNSNINGFLNILLSCRDNNVKRLIYAASSSTYGDQPDLPKKEDVIGKPLSPYAVTKFVNELYADVFSQSYNFDSIGLRYFNIFGRRQDPHGAYAAVIPIWIQSIIDNKEIYINGDGSTSRDFTYIDNAVQANILAALSKNKSGHQVFNIAAGGRTSLNDMFFSLVKIFSSHGVEYKKNPIYRDFRPGDVLHSEADISKANSILKYMPSHDFDEGLKETVLWYLKDKV
jgi:UDP-N-acetylglucosamine 4-epimerase